MTNQMISEATEALKIETLQKAKERSILKIEEIHQKLDENDWNLDLAFKNLDLERKIAQSVTIQSKSKFGKYREKSEKAEQFYIQKTLEGVEDIFQNYVNKLSEKIGDNIVSAYLEQGDNLWSYSVLSVKRVDGSIDKFKTQLIWNVSKYGLIFPQFPTRKIEKP